MSNQTKIVVSRGEYLKLMRERTRLSRVDVCKLLDQFDGIKIFPTQIARLENGSSQYLTLNLARCLAFLYNIDVKDIP